MGKTLCLVEVPEGDRVQGFFPGSGLMHVVHLTPRPITPGKPFYGTIDPPVLCNCRKAVLPVTGLSGKKQTIPVRSQQHQTIAQKDYGPEKCGEEPIQTNLLHSNPERGDLITVIM